MECPDIVDQAGYTAVHDAAMAPTDTGLSHLIGTHAVDVNQAAVFGRTPLHCASMHSAPCVFVWLACLFTSV
jgi:hypothetical protein